VRLHLLPDFMLPAQPYGGPEPPEQHTLLGPQLPGKRREQGVQTLVQASLVVGVARLAEDDGDAVGQVPDGDLQGFHIAPLRAASV
jgi:hypothetical protein